MRARVEAQALKLLSDEASRPFDLARGPLFRGMLVSLSADEHLLLLSMHHIVADGWSLDILATELSALYSANVEGRAAPLEKLSLQYADYAAWERTPAQAERLQSQLSYWKQQLAQVPALELPDRSREAGGATDAVRAAALLARRGPR